MPLSSLLSLARRACIRNVNSIDSIGDLSYDVAEPILREVTNPKQLRNIEISSPHLVGETSNIWIKFIKRDIPTQKDFAQEPEDPDDWFDLYEILLSEHQEKEKVAEQWLRDQLSGIQAKRDTNVATSIETKDMPAMDRNNRVRTYADEQRRRERLRKRAYNALPSQNLTQGSKIKINSGADVMRKVRMQARNVAAVNNASMKLGTTSREEIARRKAAALATSRVLSQPRVEKQPVRKTIRVPVLARRDGERKAERTIRLSPSFGHSTNTKFPTPPLQPIPAPKDDLFDEKNDDHDKLTEPSREDVKAMREARRLNALRRSPSSENNVRTAATAVPVATVPAPKKPSPPPRILKRKAPADPLIRAKKRVPV